MTRREPRPIRPKRACAPALLLAALVLALPTPAASKSDPPVRDKEAADRIASWQGAPNRETRLATWARGASLDDLLWLLRHGPEDLGGAEAPLVDAALRLTPPSRADLRRRLMARHWLADPAAARKAGREVGEPDLMRCRASVYNLAALLPDRGDYASYAASVRGGIEAGLAWGRPNGMPAPTLAFRGTGDGDPSRGAAVLDSVSYSCGVIVGDLLSVPTIALAAGARALGLPLVSTTATDENIGRIGPATFQIGPANALRGDRLARAMVRREGTKVVVLTSSSVAHSALVEGFTAEAESLGANIVRRDTYTPGTTDFHNVSRGLKMFAADVLFWDGDSREADALLRQLAADGISVRPCGGTALALDQFHGAARPLLEGVTWVADDWRLPAPAQAMLDSLAQARGDKAGPLWVRGFLAGRRIADAVDAGARTPSELAARLRHAHASLRAWGFLDCGLDGATLPVFTVARGRTVDAP
jgi:ABC-type branched-subunit amino acid transport system substrate-binding protein